MSCLQWNENSSVAVYIFACHHRRHRGRNGADVVHVCNGTLYWAEFWSLLQQQQQQHSTAARCKFIIYLHWSNQNYVKKLRSNDLARLTQKCCWNCCAWLYLAQYSNVPKSRGEWNIQEYAEGTVPLKAFVDLHYLYRCACVCVCKWERESDYVLRSIHVLYWHTLKKMNNKKEDEKNEEEQGDFILMQMQTLTTHTHKIVYPTIRKWVQWHEKLRSSHSRRCRSRKKQCSSFFLR